MSGSARRRFAWVAVMVFMAALAWDLSRDPPEQWTAGILLGSIDLYQATLSNGMAKVGVRCRFEPTCSYYAEEVIRRRGVLKGSWKTLGRLIRCGPWTPAGTLDQP